MSSTLLLGLGREAVSSYRALLASGASTDALLLYDDHSPDALDPFWRQPAPTAQLRTQDEVLQLITDGTITRCIKSPGVPPHHPVVRALVAAGILLESNLSLFLDAYTELKSHAQAPWQLIGITGTKGKSTATSAIHHLLSDDRLPGTSLLGGNIGVPPLELLPALQERVSATDPTSVVLELSCHQLQHTTIKPDIAVLLALSPEHLDYYPTLDAYYATKAQLCAHQTEEDLLIYSKDSEKSVTIAEAAKSQKHPFSLTDATQLHKIKTTNPGLIGDHTRLNVLPALQVGKILGIPEATILEILSTFTSLPHRLQYVGTTDDLLYYNDSLATTPDAAAAALTAVSQERPTVLIAGGYDRGLDQTPLIQSIRAASQAGQLRGLVLLPDTGATLARQLHTHHSSQALPCTRVASMPAALTAAQHLGQSGDAILLSPGAASFNLFRDYADRGAQFMAAVQAGRD